MLLIRKNGFTEIISIENEIVHEMGDKISNESVRKAIYDWIMDNHEDLNMECDRASMLDYHPKHF